MLVTEFAQGELFEILEDDQSLPEEEVQKIARQLVNQTVLGSALYALESGEHPVQLRNDHGIVSVCFDQLDFTTGDWSDLRYRGNPCFNMWIFQVEFEVRVAGINP